MYLLGSLPQNLDANTQTTRETDELEACADKILQNGKDFMDVYLQASGLHRSLSNKNASLGVRRPITCTLSFRLSPLTYFYSTFPPKTFMLTHLQ